MRGLELSAIDEYIYQTLSADGTLTSLLGAPDEIHVDTIHDKEVYPYILATMLSTAQTQVVNGYDVLTTADYQVRAVDRAQSYQAVKPIAGRIYQLLHQASGVVSDGLVLKCIRVRQLHFPTIEETISYRHLGGIYRFWVEGT